MKGNDFDGIDDFHRKNPEDLIGIERARQRLALGYSASHDDGHREQQMAWAAACLAAPRHILTPPVAGEPSVHAIHLSDPWPTYWIDFRARVKTPGEPERDYERRPWRSGDIEEEHGAWMGRMAELVKAGALIAAEMERLQRAVEVILWWDQPERNARHYRHVACREWVAPLDDCPAPPEGAKGECAECVAQLLYVHAPRLVI